MSDSIKDTPADTTVGLSRRSLLQGTAGMAGILASGLAPAVHAQDKITLRYDWKLDGFDGTPLFAGNLLAMSDAEGRVDSITLTHHSYEAAIIVLRADRWDALSAAQQLGIRGDVDAIGARARQTVRALQLDLLKEMSSKGRVVRRLSAEDHALVVRAAETERGRFTQGPEEAAVYALLREALSNTL